MTVTCGGAFKTQWQCRKTHPGSQYLPLSLHQATSFETNALQRWEREYILIKR